MGKRDNRIAFVNPVAASRSSGYTASGPTARDYLNRPRPTWDEVRSLIDKKNQGSSTLAKFEEEMNEAYRKRQEKHRNRILAKANRISKKRKRARSSSLSSSTTESSIEHRKRAKRLKKKTSKRRKKYLSKEREYETNSSAEDTDMAKSRTLFARVNRPSYCFQLPHEISYGPKLERRRCLG
ncbi:protein FAM133B-like isoform X2 [Rhopilema esculentum]|uniref:protein FAM133B-like isoform X2 n=1 Tax=Rhopilema esculentum TaxID=499914 RepID=UPI0031D8B132